MLFSVVPQCKGDGVFNVVRGWGGWGHGKYLDGVGRGRWYFTMKIVCHLVYHNNKANAMSCGG